MWSMSAKFELHSGLLVKKNYRLIVKDGVLFICYSLSGPKDSFGFFCFILWKNPTEVFDQPNDKLHQNLEA